MNDLQGITKEEAREALEDAFDEQIYNLMYYSWPQVFSNTAGPFSAPGMFAGQAFTEFQMECWTDGTYAYVFSKGREVRVIKCIEPFSIEWYTRQRNYS